MPLISASLIICEKILNEQDGVLSAIRLGDQFILDAAQFESPKFHLGVRFSAIGIAKFGPDDSSAHTGALRLIRPNGESSEVYAVATDLGQLEIRFPGTPRGFNILADVNVTAKQIGTHFLAFIVDGQEVARASFTLVLQHAKTETQEAE